MTTYFSSDVIYLTQFPSEYTWILSPRPADGSCSYYKYSSSDTNVATVSKSSSSCYGSVTIKNTGQTTLTASYNNIVYILSLIVESPQTSRYRSTLGARIFHTRDSVDFFRSPHGTKNTLGNKHPLVGIAKKRDASSKNRIGGADAGGVGETCDCNGVPCKC